MSTIHVVWFKWSDNATDAQIEATGKALVEMKDLMNASAEKAIIEELTFGKNFTQRSKGFTHGLVVKLTSPEMLPVYDAHPAHQAVVANHIALIRGEVMALDFVDGVC
jgi:hypothetical protein